MTVGAVIRHYRKQKNMTQEEMASRLGVTAPAVNKWERGNTLPDVALLAPIARLLGISTDTLLSFREELTDGEVQQFLSTIQRDLESRDFPDVFLRVKEKIEEYPNCDRLIWQAALILDAHRMARALPNRDDYEPAIFGWYGQCLQSQDEGVRTQAADALFHAYFRKQDYEKAAQYLAYFSTENPERKRREALVNSKTGKRGEAYRAYEELLYTGHQHMQLVLNDLRSLYMEDEDHEMVKKLVQVSSATASALEMGRYSEIFFGLDAAAWEQDTTWTAQLMQELLDSVETIGDSAKSRLYQHMTPKSVDPAFFPKLRQELLKSFGSETFSYMQGTADWENLKRRADL